MFNTISRLVKLNPNLFFDFKKNGYILRENFNQLAQLEQALIYKEIEWTKYFFTLSKLGSSRFLNTFITYIIEYTPPRDCSFESNRTILLFK
jgi:hypothetical protein